MKLSVRSHNTPLLALALCLACVCVCARMRRTRAQESVALPPVRLVAELKGYEGPSGFNGRPAVALFSPDGRTFVLSGEGRTVRFYEAATGRLLFALAGEKEGANGFSFSPDSTVGATRNLPDRSVSVWDLTTGKLLLKLAGRAGGFETKLKATITITTEFDPVPFSPDGRVLLSEREDDVVAAWDSSKGRQLFTLEHKTESNAAKDVLGFGFGKLLLLSAAFSPDGRLLLTSSEKGVRLWDTSNGALITTLERSRFPAHFSPDARRLVTGGTDKTAYLYELRAD